MLLGPLAGSAASGKRQQCACDKQCGKGERQDIAVEREQRWGFFQGKRRVDATGAKPFLLLGLGLYAIVAVYWWVYLKIDSQAIAGVFAVYFLLGLGTACWTIANLNYLPQVTGER